MFPDPPSLARYVGSESLQEATWQVTSLFQLSTPMQKQKRNLEHVHLAPTCYCCINSRHVNCPGCLFCRVRSRGVCCIRPPYACCGTKEKLLTFQSMVSLVRWGHIRCARIRVPSLHSATRPRRNPRASYVPECCVLAPMRAAVHCLNASSDTADMSHHARDTPSVMISDVARQETSPPAISGIYSPAR